MFSVKLVTSQSESTQKMGNDLLMLSVELVTSQSESIQKMGNDSLMFSTGDRAFLSCSLQHADDDH